MTDESGKGLLTSKEVPEWFTYPPGFLRIYNQGLVNFEPWKIIKEDRLRYRLQGLKNRYPKRNVIPFAERQDNDDVACFEKGVVGVVIIHDYASQGWESREGFDSFWDWLRSALEETIYWD
ncbi:MAG: hypothetical protein JJ960_06350 [Kordiimonadaceae bacterium]|nr:hypothetical protein [Kordiimonadaceae bacterium]MBO6568351.1 hypothetical protein [Kordiimonadaceae bacterium]